MKRVLFFLIAFIMLSLVCCACAAGSRQEGDWIYEVVNKTARIEKYNPSDDPPEILTVPETLGGYPVGEIAGFAFWNMRETEGGETEKMPGARVLILPDEIQSIRPNGIAFHDLEEIRIDNGTVYETIDGVLFHRETHTLVTYPGGRKGSDYRVPEGTLVIGENAFNDPEYLRNVVLADSVRTIEKDAFQIQDMHLAISVNVSRIDAGALSGADRITSDSSRYQMIDGMLIDTEENILVCVPEESCTGGAATIRIPEGIETIGKNAFYYISCREVILPSTLKKIEDFNQIRSISLGSLLFPDGLESIGDFFDASGVTELVFPSSLKSIGSHCFTDSNDLESIVFREGVESIGRNSFCRNKNLKTVILPRTLETIGETYFSETGKVFDGCPMLEAKVLPGTAAERFCKKKEIPYQYTFSGLWQAEEPEAKEILSLPDADRILIRLDSDTLELTYILNGSENREIYPIHWRDGMLCMDGGYMNYRMDGRQLILEMDDAQIRLTAVEETK